MLHFENLEASLPPPSLGDDGSTSRASGKQEGGLTLQPQEREEDTLFQNLEDALRSLQSCIKVRDYAGHEPYALLNSPYLAGQWARRPPFNVLFIQFGKRFGGALLRRILRVPVSKNPKALGLMLSAYADLAHSGEDIESEAQYLKSELGRLRSPGERTSCWGYDWDYFSLRGTSVPAFGPNCIASYFCGSALLDMFEALGDTEAKQMALSV